MTKISLPAHRKLFSYRLIIGSAVVILTCLLSILGVVYFRASKQEIFTLPAGYVGPVLIIYDQPDGTPPFYEEGVQVFEIPLSGLLLTQSSKPDGIGDNFWYRNELGRRTEKLIFNQNCVIPVPDDPVIVCVQAETMIINDKIPPRHHTFIVGPQSQLHKLATGYYEWTREYLLSRPPN